MLICPLLLIGVKPRIAQLECQLSLTLTHLAIYWLIYAAALICAKHLQNLAANLGIQRTSSPYRILMSFSLNMSKLPF